MVGNRAGGAAERPFGGALFRSDRGRPRPGPLYSLVETKNEALGFYNPTLRSVEFYSKGYFTVDYFYKHFYQRKFSKNEAQIIKETCVLYFYKLN